MALPARALAQRFAVLMLIAAAIVLLLIGKTDNQAISRLRVLAMDAVAPVLEVLSRPVEAGSQVVEEVRRFWFTYQENADLRQRLERLTQWQEIARHLERENAVLKAQLNFAPATQPSFVSARVLSDSGGQFVRTMLINAGQRDGVRNGQAVVISGGLVGRVVEAGQRSARLLLLTDLNSRVPVVLESTRYRGILAGDNSGQPKLIYLPGSAKVAAGDRITTSGHGGVFPPGLPVGVVASVAEGDIRVQPFVDWERIEFVSVLRYELPHFREFGRPGQQPAAAKQ